MSAVAHRFTEPLGVFEGFGILLDEHENGVPEVLFGVLVDLGAVDLREFAVGVLPEDADVPAGHVTAANQPWWSSMWAWFMPCEAR